MASYTIASGDQLQESRVLARASTGRLWIIYNRTNFIVSVAYSDDNGETWTASDVIDGGAQRLDFYGAIAIDSDDLVHIAYAGAALVHRSRPSDLSSDWSAEHTILNQLIDGVSCSNLVVDSSDNLHILYTRVYVLYYKNSGDAGETWSGATTIYSTEDVYSHFMAIDTDNDIHVAFDSNGTQIMYRIYTGGAWQAVENVSSVAGVGDLVVYSYIATDSNNVIHVVWYLDGTATKIYYNNRIAGVWGAEQTLSSSAGDFDASIGVDQYNNIYVVWHRAGDDIYMLKSTDGGLNWSVASAFGLADLNTYAVPNLIFATFPQSFNIPGMGYAFIYNTSSNTNFYKPTDLDWTKITAWLGLTGDMTFG